MKWHWVPWGHGSLATSLEDWGSAPLQQTLQAVSPFQRHQLTPSCYTRHLSLSSLSLAEVWGILIPVPRVWSAESKPPEHRGSPVTSLSLALLLSSAEIEEIYRMHCERFSTLITERSQLGCLGWDSFQNSLTSAFNSEQQGCWASLVALKVRNLPAMPETPVRSLGPEDPLEEGIATHSSILAWRIPWTEGSGGLQSMGHKESDTTEWLTHTQPGCWYHKLCNLWI